jgi:hypothetical protein
MGHAVVTNCRKLKSVRLGITSKGLMFIPNFVKNSELVQNLRGEHTCAHARTHTETGSGAHPASYPMGTGDSFPKGKAAGE